MLPSTSGSASNDGLRHLIICYLDNEFSVIDKYKAASLPAKDLPEYGILCIPKREMTDAQITETLHIVRHFKWSKLCMSLDEAIESLGGVDPQRIELYCLSMILVL